MLQERRVCYCERKGCHFHWEGKCWMNFSLPLCLLFSTPPLEDIVQCMTQLNAFYCTSVPFLPPKSLTSPDRLKDWKTDGRRADAEYSSVIPHAALALFIFCISEPAHLLTTVVNFGRLIMPLSVHSSVASGSIVSEGTHCKCLTVRHCNTLTLCVHMPWGWCMYTHIFLSLCILFLVMGAQPL